MALVFHRGVTIPVWAAAFCAVALSAPRRVMPSLMALAGISVIASVMPAIVRWVRPSRPRLDVLPAVDQDPAARAGIVMTAGARSRTLDNAIAARTVKADDAEDLVRMDDDGGSQMARQPALTAGPARRRDQRSDDTRS
jgi:hypothetical protein